MRKLKLQLQLAGSLTAIVFASAVSAQTPETLAPAPVEEELGEIVVTGSRLAQDPNAVSASPITTVTAAQLRIGGQTDIAETLREIPALLSSGTIEDSLERGAGGVGQATLDLRGLGANRTLVLVNGRRHVSGVAGSQAVDIATIPSALIESVEVLTGGASSIYGADAVTGVVNFNLKSKYEGLSVDSQIGISDRGDSRRFSVDVVYGKNFAEGRGNVTFGVSYADGQEVQFGDRDYARDNAQANAGLTYGNPVRRFQEGDIGGSTPNFARFYNIDRGIFVNGSSIPTSAAAFITSYRNAFGTDPVLSAAETALITRAANSPTLAIGQFPVFAISSNAGVVSRADYDYFALDLDGNGVEDCLQSNIGVRFAGCYVTTAGGGVRPFRDGIISTNANQFGGDGAVETVNGQSLIPQNQRYNFNLNSQYEFSDFATGFIEAKYARTNTVSFNPYNTFYDNLYIAPDNPFIPAVLQADADDAGGLYIARDFLDLGTNASTSNRDTYRLVGGFKGDLSSHLRYEISGTYGRTDNKTVQANSVLPDRLFAAIDVTTGANGQPICRSDISSVANDPAAPVPENGFYTFSPGDGRCVPVNLFNGVNSVSAAGVNFITVPTTRLARLQQYVANVEFSGDTGGFFNLPGGAVQFAIGGEYREERSDFQFDPLELGILPAGSGAGPAGTFIGDISDVQDLTFDGTTRSLNTGGSFNVYEAFGEIRLPIFKLVPFAEELQVGAAARFSSYSSIGRTVTWSVNGVYAPIRDIKFRATYANAVRAPNISELFSPAQGTTFRPADPCEQSAIDALLAANDPNAQNRLNNCRADGIPAGYSDPLTSRFSGTTGGNPNLQEETARTITAGLILQPRFLKRLTLTADYYNIKITNAISAVTSQDIVDNCYDNTSFPNQYCDLFTRNRNSASPTFLGLNFLRQTQLNFGRIETAGVDFTAAYSLDIGKNQFNLRMSGNWVQRINRFFDPGDPTLVNPGLRELGSPEWAGTGSFNWKRGKLSVNYQLQYIGNQGLAPVSIERVDIQFGPSAFAGETFVHDVAVTLDIDKGKSVYFGVNNLTDVSPYITNSAYPVSPAGRYLFVGARARF